MQHIRLKWWINRVKRRLLSKVHLARFLLCLLGLVLLGLLFVTGVRIDQVIKSYTSSPLIQTSEITNILLLGIGGAGHDGADLTDSIILLSLNHSNKHISLISIPRDIWLPSLKSKINMAYHYGESTSPGGGLILAKSSVSEIVDQPIHYAAVIDFSTFEKIIDMVGGVDIHVDTEFTDSTYPIPGKEADLCGGDPQTRCRYETVHFAPGPIHLDGESALKFVRSRHAPGNEGTDFARSARQEKVITSFKNKLLSTSVFSRPSLYFQLYRLIVSSIHTDIPKSSYGPALYFAWQSRKQTLSAYSISQPDQLDHPPISSDYLNQWVLVPKNNDPEVIKAYVRSLISPDIP